MTRRNPSSDFEWCRGFNHDWPGKPDMGLLKAHHLYGAVIEVVQKCRTCGSERYRYLDPDNGLKVAGGYLYAEGYLRVGEGRMSPEEAGQLRLDAVRSMKITPIRKRKAV